jgi:hypothetical protein
MASTLIKDLEELRRLAAREEGVDCFIALNGGMRSSKHIVFSPPDPAHPTCHFCRRPWSILNEIDDSWQSLGDHGLWHSSNIGEALDRGALWRYDYN